MTEKQRKFCFEYVQSGNATAAAKSAGYSARTAYSQGQRMLKNVEIQNFIKELAEPSENQSIAAAQEVLTFLSTVMRDKESPLQYRLRAAENLAKRYGVDKPAGQDEEQRQPTKIIHINGSLSEEELEKLLND